VFGLHSSALGSGHVLAGRTRSRGVEHLLQKLTSTSRWLSLPLLVCAARERRPRESLRVAEPFNRAILEKRRSRFISLDGDRDRL